MNWFFCSTKNKGVGRNVHNMHDISTINKMGRAGAAPLGPLAPYPAGQLDVFGHDGDALCVDGAQVGVLKQADQVSLAGLLKSTNSSALETKVGFEVLCDLSDQALERQLADQQLSGLLVAADFTKSHSSWPVAMRLLYSTGGGRAFPGSLGGQLLPRSLSSG